MLGALRRSLSGAHATWIRSHRGFFDHLGANHSDKSEVDQQAIQDTLRHLHADLDRISDRIENQVANDLTNLNDTAQYYFTRRGKRFRPALILLMHHALDYHLHHASSSRRDSGSYHVQVSEKPRLLAQAAEMIHTASLVHDDILDEAAERRGQTSIPIAHGNQAAVLCGDYLLAKANLTLSEIGHAQVHVHMSQVLVELVQGEFMQLNHHSAFDDYLQKTYYKSASMMAHSCAAVALLSNAPEAMVQSVQEYGGHVGMAFQLKDDLLDMTGSSENMGKVALNDLKMGLITAPTYFALEEDPDLAPLLAQLKQPHSEEHVTSIIDRIGNTKAIERTESLISDYSLRALRCIDTLVPSPASWILQDIATAVGTRKL